MARLGCAASDVYGGERMDGVAGARQAGCRRPLECVVYVWDCSAEANTGAATRSK